MKYKVKAAGLYHIDEYFAYGAGFPANLKGFDYTSAIERGLIEENDDGELPTRPTKEAIGDGIQGASDKRDSEKSNI